MLCIVCGNSDDEIRLFCFPKQVDRSNEWQRLMCMVPSVLSARRRICSKHFTADSFDPRYAANVRLRKDAVPTLHPASETQEEYLDNHKDQNAAVIIVNDVAVKLNPAPESQPLKEVEEVCIVETAEDIIDDNHLSIDDVFELNQAPESQPTKEVHKDQNPEVIIDNDHVHTDPLNAAFCSGVDLPLLESNSTLSRSREQFWKKKLQSKVRQLRKLQRCSRRRGKIIKKLRGKFGVGHVTDYIQQNLPPITATFVNSQIRCANQVPHARRWELDEKIMYLALSNLGAKSYSFLQRIIPMPSKDTLTRLLTKIPFDVGINWHIFKYLGECIKSYAEEERFCTVAFDEMAICEHMQCSNSEDCVEELVDLGNGKRSDHLANYALVFMAQGISKQWKQPLAYYFSRNGASAAQLQEILREILSALREVGIPVVATICEMRPTNVKLLQAMGSTCSDPYIMVDDQKVFTIFDVPHLLKCTRNLFRKYNIMVPAVTLSGSQQIMKAKWSDIVYAVDMDRQGPYIYRSLLKIKDIHLNPIGQSAMKVNFAAQTMSRTMSASIVNLVRQGLLLSRALATSTFLFDVDEMFDSLNGRSSERPPEGKPYRCMVTQNSGHETYWEECYKKIKNWRYVRMPSDLDSEVPWMPPSQRGWMTTLKAFIGVQRQLQSIGVYTFKPRLMNQDALEDLFGLVRAGCGLNENPTVCQFISSLKSQIVNGLATQSVQGTNCELDEAKLLANFRSLLTFEVDPLDISEGQPESGSSQPQPSTSLT